MRRNRTTRVWSRRDACPTLVATAVFADYCSCRDSGAFDFGICHSPGRDDFAELETPACLHRCRRDGV